MISIYFLKDKLKLLFYLFCFKLIVELSYIYVVQPLYEYTKLDLNMNIISGFFSYLCLTILVFIFPKNKNEPSYYLYFILVLFIYIPLGSYFWLSSQPTLYYLYVVFCFWLIAFIIQIKKPTLNDFCPSSSIILYGLFVLYLGISIYLIISRGGIDLRAFYLEEIYSLRAENTIGSIQGYLLNWAAKVFCPFFVAYFLYKKKYGYMLIVILFQMGLFLSYGYKAYLFSILMLLLVILSSKNGKFEKRFTFGISITVALGSILQITAISNVLVNTIAYRLIFVPAQIQYQYYDFFVNKEKMYYSQGVVGKLLKVENDYDQPISFIIAMYYQGVVSNSNTGVFSDAYANGGIGLMIAFSILLAMILSIIDVITKNIPVTYTVAALSYIMFVLNDNSLLTSLLTGGLALMIILLYIFNTEINAKGIDRENV